MIYLDKITHIAYSDESSHNVGRYRSIAMVSLNVSIIRECDEKLKELLQQSDVREFKWNKVKDARMREAGRKLIDFILPYLESGQMRCDILMWDTHDARHTIMGRDDSANLERMYYHLIREVLTNKWNDDTDWVLRPDQHSSIDWDALQKFLEYKDSSLEHKLDLIENALYLRQHYKIKVIRECQSDELPLVQLADLFAGMAQHSWNDFDTYKTWQIKNTNQLYFNELIEVDTVSNKKQEQWLLIDHLKQQCTLRKWGVSLSSSGGLRTYSHGDDNRPVNFWLYTPQHDKDKAPIKTHGKVTK